jgi:hypothetical protein
MTGTVDLVRCIQFVQDWSINEMNTFDLIGLLSPGEDYIVQKVHTSLDRQEIKLFICLPRFLMVEGMSLSTNIKAQSLFRFVKDSHRIEPPFLVQFNEDNEKYSLHLKLLPYRPGQSFTVIHPKNTKRVKVISGR